MNEQEFKEKLVNSLKLARECWEEADMPYVYPNTHDETGKVALAILAVEILKNKELNQYLS